MIEVELPDGTIAEFPDGTPHATIEAALRRRFDSAPVARMPEPPLPTPPPAIGPRRVPQPQPELIVDENRRDARPFPERKPPRILLRPPK
jgi:hypothetical protein